MEFRHRELDPQFHPLKVGFFSAEFDIIQLAISVNDLQDILKSLIRIFFEQDPAKGE